MNNVDLRESIDKEKIDESLNSEGVLVFYKGSLIRKI
jgi:hypothetical protein